MPHKSSLVILGSGAGSTAQFLCQKFQSQDLPGQIVSLITDNSHSPISSIAKEFKVPYHFVEFKALEKEIWDKNLSQVLLSYQPQLILLAGFLKKIGPMVLNQFKNKIINSHPALIPEFSGTGWYGSRIHQAVIDQKKKTTGVTIHLVNQDYDAGRILHQETIVVEEGETAIDLERRVKKIEKDVYFKTVLQIISGKVIL